MVSLRNMFSSSSPLLATLLLATPVLSQTSSTCNPTKGQTCPADPALGRAASYDFTSGASKDFNAGGNPTYSSNGVSFTVSKSGDAPQLNSNWYIMFGKYEITMQAAPGAGIVSSVVLQSDDLDEIDWEFLGANPTQGQTNYFGKADTSSSQRAAFLTVPNTQNFHTYGVEWTEKQIIWSVDGTTVRVLTYDEANGQYPQTPMQLKFGVWAGGDPSNPPGTIQWAEGPTSYASGPFTMVVKSLSVTDYSTGTSYKYGDATGSWGSISANGGSINGNAGGATETVAASPAITSTSSGGVPWTGTHRSQTTLTTTYTTYPGLPSGWSVTSSGKVVPPSAAPSLSPSPQFSPSPSPSPQGFSPGSPGAEGLTTITTYNQQGFMTTMAIPTGAKSYDQQGFLITAGPAAAVVTGAAAADQLSQDRRRKGSSSTTTNNNGAGTLVLNGLLAGCGALVAILAVL